MPIKLNKSATKVSYDYFQNLIFYSIMHFKQAALIIDIQPVLEIIAPVINSCIVRNMLQGINNKQSSERKRM